MIESLSDRIKYRTKEIKHTIKKEKFIEELLNLFRGLPLWSEIGEENMWLSDALTWWYILTIAKKIDVQIVEDTFCRAIRQKYGNTWEMVADNDAVILKTYFKSPNPDFHIKIKNPDFPGCEIIKIPVRTYTDEELEEKRVEYEYLIQCNGKEEDL